MIPVMSKRITNFLRALLPLFLLSACSNSDVYFQYKTINQEGWNKDSVLTFDVKITDTTSAYNVYVNIRNSGDYPYQNLWLFLNKTDPDSTSVNDSIECYLADQRGKWLGSGVGSIKEMPVLYEQNKHFTKSGIYKYSVVQGMREDVLKGINDVGIRIEKVK